ncbi:MAG: metallophosphoesterase [Holophagales bacterium]|nr:metallophosphoesterase [Holophagales bacterium]
MSAPAIRPSGGEHPGARRRLGLVGDVHGELGRLELALHALAEQRPDALLFVGDLVSPGWERRFRAGPKPSERFGEDLRGIFERARALEVPVAWVPGNHDLPSPFHPRSLDPALNTDRRHMELAGLTVYGIGGAGPARFGFPYEWGEAEIASLEPGPLDLLLSHTPPFRSGLDRTHSGKFVGSEAVRAHCRQTRALACGHIHEAAGVSVVEGCLCVNVGALGEPFGREQIAWIDFEDDSVTGTHLDLITGRRASDSVSGSTPAPVPRSVG